MSRFDTSASSMQPSMLAKAMACVANAIFITDKSGQIVWMNNAFSQLSGYSTEDTIGCTPAILQSGKQNASTYANLWETILAGQVWQGELVDQHKDGTLYTVDEVITPLFNEQGIITHFIAIQHDITRLRQESEHDRHLAYHDLLTGLPNRAHFLDMQERAISYAKRTQNKLATLFLDLDKFKPINDTLGHRAGDQLLATVAERLSAAVRQTDIVARLGGDEFAILLVNLPDKGVATALASKLIDILSKPFAILGSTVHISASIGIAIYPADGEKAEALLSNADKAMYQAKSQGGNRYQLYDAADVPTP